MTESRRAARLLAACAAAIGATLAAPASAQTYPDHTIRVTVGFAAGSASDIVPRIVLEKAATLLGKPNVFVVENMPGAGGNTGLAVVARGEPTGYHLGASAIGPLAINKTLFKSPGFDVEADFEPITNFTLNPNVVVVSNKTQFKSLKELADYAKANPDKLTYSSVGPGSSQHLGGVQFELITGAVMRHLPYRITGQLVTDLITGEVPLSFQNIINVIEQARGGQVRVLAICSKTRHPTLPDVPTSAEAGLPEFLSGSWFGIVAPKGTPKPIVDKLNGAIVAALKDPDVVKRLHDIGAEPDPQTPAEFKAFISAEVARWRDIITKAKLPQM